MPTPSEAPDRALLALRQATAGWHQRLEAQMDVFGRVRTLEAYRRMLAGFYAAHVCLERFWAAVPLGARGTRLALGSRHKSAQLAGDLMALGLSPTALQALPVASVPAHWGGAAECLGSLYVVEGATLGGQVMARHFHRALGVGPGVGGDYLVGYGAHTGRQWRACRTMLAQELSTPDELAQACTAACETFALFWRSLGCGGAMAPR